ncbi:MAG: hypothetical protein ACE5JJ_07120 [Nitrospinota bacterium]
MNVGTSAPPGRLRSLRGRKKTRQDLLILRVDAVLRRYWRLRAKRSSPPTISPGREKVEGGLEESPAERDLAFLAEVVRSLAVLSPTERQAALLRHPPEGEEPRSLRAIAAALGLSFRGARAAVERAQERLASEFRKRGLRGDGLQRSQRSLG